MFGPSRLAPFLAITLCSIACRIPAAPPALEIAGYKPTLVYEMGHTDAVQFADFARAGSVLVTVGATQAIEWDVASGHELRRFRGHTDNVRAVAIHANDVATGASDGTIKVWNLATGAIRRDIRLRPRGDQGSSRSVRALAFTEDFKTLVALDEDYGAHPKRNQFLTRYDGSTFIPTGQTKLPSDFIDFGTFSKNGRFLAIKFDDTTLTIYETAHGRQLFSFNPSNWEANRPFTGRAIVFSQDSSRFATLSENNGILVYRTRDGALLSTISHNLLPGNVDGAVFSADNRDLVVSLIVNPTIGDTVGHPVPMTSSYIQTLVWSRIDAAPSVIASIAVGQMDLIYANGCCNRTGLRESGVGTNVEYLTFMPGDGNLLLTMSDGKSYEVDTATGKIHTQYASNVAYVQDLAVSADGSWLATAVSSSVSFWSTRTGRVEETAGPLNLHSTRGTMIFEGPFLQMKFLDSHVVSIADSGDFYDIDLDSKTTSRTNRVLNAGYLATRNGDLGLVDSGKDQEIRPNAFGRDVFLATGSSFDTAGRHAVIETQTFSGQILTAPVPAILSRDGSAIFLVHDQMPCQLDTTSMEQTCFGPTSHEREIHDMKLDEKSGRLFLASDLGSSHGSAEVWSVTNAKEVAEMRLDTPVLAIAPAEGGGVAFIGDLAGRVSKWRVDDCKPRAWRISRCSPLWTSDQRNDRIDALAVTADDKYVLSGGTGGLITVASVRDGSPVLTMALAGAHWLVSAPDGRFDTDDLDDTPGLHWSVGDDPFHPLTPNAFFRNYFQPGLLAQVLSGAPALGAAADATRLQDLNRAAPNVSALRISAEHSDGTVDVSLDLSPGSYAAQGGSGPHASDVTRPFDLRLFCDGQLIDSVPHARPTTPDGLSTDEKAQWRLDMQVLTRNDQRVVEHGDSATVTFSGVRLPTSAESGFTELTAYAFNSDRVRSTPISVSVPRPKQNRAARAFIVSIGINNYGGYGWNLHYAVKDARQVIKYLPDAIKTHGFEVVQERLISDDADRQAGEVEATKQNVIDAVKRVVQRSTPDDLVLIYFSGHGYGGSGTGFNLLVSDGEPWLTDWSQPTPEDLAKTISANDLLEALRGVSASEIAIIVDACHAAAAIASGAWRPGPLGSPTFGQLAYDKRMEVLAASQTQDKALELAGDISEGVLTYALIHDGLRAAKGVDTDGRINLRSLMRYSAARVPGVLKDIATGTLDDYHIPIDKDTVAPPVSTSEKATGNRQLPEFFDFSRKRPSTPLQ